MALQCRSPIAFLASGMATWRSGGWLRTTATRRMGNRKNKEPFWSVGQGSIRWLLRIFKRYRNFDCDDTNPAEYRVAPIWGDSQQTVLGALPKDLQTILRGFTLPCVRSMP